MNYGRDYGNRNFLERAAHTVRGWFGEHGGRDYDAGYRGGPMNRGWDDDRGYREMGDVSGYRGYTGGGADRGYGTTNWQGRNQDWNRGTEGGWGRGGGEGYRTGGYHAGHGTWDTDWDDDRTRDYGGMDRGMNRGGMSGGGMSAGGMNRGGMDRGWSGGDDDRDHFMGRDYMTNHPHFGHGWRSGHTDDDTMDMNRGMSGLGMSGGMDRDRDAGRGDWNRTGGGGMMGRGMQGGMNRGYDRDWDDRGDWNRGQQGGGNWNRGGAGMADRNQGGAGMLGRDANVGDVTGGMIGNHGAYGNYGIERFRSASGGGVPTGQHYRGYGVGSGYRP